MGFIPGTFGEFLREGCDRASFIQAWLNERGVESSALLIDGKKHVLVRFASQFYDPRFKLKTVIAHHDRVAASSGANDNSAAVWQIMSWAVRLATFRGFHNVRILFTDGEELGQSVTRQGAFAIAQTFRRLGMTNQDVYVFDACGRGDVPVLSKSGLSSFASDQFKKDFTDLFSRTQRLLKRAAGGKMMTLPVPYSDNASFLACAIPAVAVTLLPSAEAELWARCVAEDRELETSLLHHSSEGGYPHKDKLPLTWQLFHTTGDTQDTLDEASFALMSAILDELAREKTPV